MDLLPERDGPGALVSSVTGTLYPYYSENTVTAHLAPLHLQPAAPDKVTHGAQSVCLATASQLAGNRELSATCQTVNRNVWAVMLDYCNVRCHQRCLMLFLNKRADF